MKKNLLILLCMVVIGLGSLSSFPFNSAHIVHAQKDVPPYAKWGNIAVQKTKDKYPDAQVVDYLHVGRERKDKTSIEKFKLWLKGKDREFGVYVNIEFTNASEQIIVITYKEVDR